MQAAAGSRQLNDDLERLLDEARETGPETRLPMYRDPIASYGADAVEPVGTWLDEPVLQAFAIRTLERIAQLHPDTRGDVLAMLAEADPAALRDAIRRDRDDAMRGLGVDPAKHRRRGGGVPGRIVHNPGVSGRGYWAMRTSPWERPYIWQEATSGRLRQGWGWADDQELHRIADLTRRGIELSEEQQMAWPSRRMLPVESDGMGNGDWILTPNLPQWGRLSVFELTGSYRYEPDAPRRFGDRFGHILPVRLLAEDIDRYGSLVSDTLRSTTRNPGRLWNITAYGGDIERMVDPEWVPAEQPRRCWSEADYAELFSRHPVDGPRPSGPELEQTAEALGRSTGAVDWQWEDGSAYVSGRSAGTTSGALKAWLDTRHRNHAS